MKKNIQDFKDRTPFEVPEGYFDNLSVQIMESLPERESNEITVPKVSLWIKLKPLAYLAAMFIGAALIIRVLVGTNTLDDECTALITVEEVSDEFLYDTVEQAFIDDYAMHLFLTSNLE